MELPLSWRAVEIEPSMEGEPTEGLQTGATADWPVLRAAADAKREPSLGERPGGPRALERQAVQWERNALAGTGNETKTGPRKRAGARPNDNRTLCGEKTEQPANRRSPRAKPAQSLRGRVVVDAEVLCDPADGAPRSCIAAASAAINEKIDWGQCPHIERDPEIMSGAWCCEGTRVPISALFMNLASGLSIPEFMEQFPNARAEHIKAVLNFQADRLDATSSQPAR